MRHGIISDDTRQYGLRPSDEVRSTLLELTRDFIHSARNIPGVDRISMLGSLLTDKPLPKDTDLLVTVAEGIDLTRLARLGRRLKGTALSRINSGADVFLANPTGKYIGRICHYRQCHPRVACRARHCGAIPHLADDLDVVQLSDELIARPPLELYPLLIARVTLPADVRRILLDPSGALK